LYIACRDVIILRGYLDIKERRKQIIMNNIDDLVEIYECPLCETMTDLMQQSALLIYGTVARLFP